MAWLITQCRGKWKAKATSVSVSPSSARQGTSQAAANQTSFKILFRHQHRAKLSKHRTVAQA
ncbi:hypothetical protein MGYG_09037 [Nannizzia gypsea CBS 118893]|uniref:Uncharacterized protein n=1 Tax=Arthroderma gypseum (strain ATCC MYA-4604 / CBS 118893) TaxID=535722 RepID=E4UUG3_ARTGP|nr:hypothetical protein MGYG_09037 [Nannizzia gypsea CBS 118893]EFR00930.1 hypothetical protein MGYG_09037 [Nannizzia gypsea CBS 118893]